MNSYLTLTKTFIASISMSQPQDKRRKIMLIILSFFCCLLYTAAGRIWRWHLSKINDRNFTADRLRLPWYSAYVPCDLSVHRDLWHQCNL